MKLFSTVLNEGKAEQIIEKSKFICHVKPVSNRDEGEAFIAEVKKNYKDATHNVPAMVIGEKMQIQWASDDGEPQGTSGAPMVKMLVNEGITNVVIVVTRYFGGIKLGTGGLVRAYTSSAKLGLSEAGICDVMEKKAVTFKIDYTYLNKIQSLEREGDYVIDDIKYTDKVEITLNADCENEEKLKTIIDSVTSGKSEIIKEEVLLVKLSRKS